jgi:hypothetical protein
VKLNEAVATASTMFVKPLLYSEFDKRDKEAQKSLYDLKKMKIDREKYNDKDFLEKLVFYKWRIF